MKVEVLKFNPELLAEFLRKEPSLNTHLPDDAELVDLKLDLTSNEVFAVFRTNGNEKQVVESAEENEKQCKSISKIGACGISESIENKFTAQQRELLSFEVMSGTLLIKPKQSLGNNWFEINDIVQKLGGSWNVGNANDYWEIPLL